MVEYALLIDSQFKEIRNYSERPVDIPHKGVSWYPVFRTIGPEEHSGLGGTSDYAYVDGGGRGGAGGGKTAIAIAAGAYGGGGSGDE